MSKKHHDLKDIEVTKNLLKDLPTEELLRRINLGSISERGRKAINQILKERGVKK